MRFWRVRAQATASEVKKKKVSIHAVAERAAG
jgi:hypothetical protein